MLDADTMRVKSRGVFRFFGHLDLFRVVQDRDRHLSPATTYGAAFSTAATVLIALLVLQETVGFFRGTAHSTIFVPSREQQRKEPMEPVNIDVSFPHLPCHLVGIVVVDQHGIVMEELMRPSSATRTRLAPGAMDKVLGPYMGGAVDGAEGCRLRGHIMIDNVIGHFFIGAMGVRGSDTIKADHVLHDMWIGNVRLDRRHDDLSEAVVNPLHNTKKLHDAPGTIHKYFLQVVATYFRREGAATPRKLGYQFTATASDVVAPDIPVGLYFTHKHATFAVAVETRYDSWSHFLVGLCAIAGGVYTVLGFAAAACSIAAEHPTVTDYGNALVAFIAGAQQRMRPVPPAQPPHH